MPRRSSSSSGPSPGWDPWLLVAQIITMQAIHYLALCVFVPPLLGLFAETESLSYEGGAANVGMIVDWRELSSRGTWNMTPSASLSWPPGWPRHVSPQIIDVRRGWCIALSWLAASVVDIYYLYIFVRRPRLILDFALTLVGNHLIVTTYYAGALPASVFFWVVMLAGAGLTTVCGEKLCVRRELREGLREEFELLARRE